ncbi:MAG TPA: transcription antitermination factor NusB [Bacillota bacterium]|nr:transcription antitermination factor NusB [Bacillota bacterium]
MNRHEAREKAFQILFQIDMNDIDPQSAMKSYLGTVEADSFLNTLIQGVVKNKTSIDETIMNHMENWSIHRIALVEKTIMRIATYEIMFLDDIPPGVSINEAVELAKIYGDEKSSKFVNGVLSKIIT